MGVGVSTPGEAGPETALGPPAALDNEILERLGAIEGRLRDTQAMAARAYEASFRWPQVLEAVRAEPGYEAAYSGEPLVTVRVATYNASSLLCERALASLRRQTYSRWEAIVVGDACTDDTEDRVRALGDPRIRFLNLPFQGPYPEDDLARWYIAGSRPFNVALQQAAGQWIAPLDHDDEWDSDHIEVLLKEAQESRAELVYGRIRIVDTVSGAESEMGTWPPVRGQFGFLGALHHRGLRVFQYDENCRFADEPGDWNLMRRMWDAGVRFRFLDRPVATNYFTPRHRTFTTEQRMIEELRDWARQLEEARDWWRREAERFEAQLGAQTSSPGAGS